MEVTTCRGVALVYCEMVCYNYKNVQKELNNMVAIHLRRDLFKNSCYIGKLRRYRSLQKLLYLFCFVSTNTL